jgi:hypothetical protein
MLAVQLRSTSDLSVVPVVLDPVHLEVFPSVPLQQSTSNRLSADRSNHDWERLGWILLQKRWISADHLQAALLHQLRYPQKLGEILLTQALISEDQLRDALREQYWRRNGYWVI